MEPTMTTAELAALTFEPVPFNLDTMNETIAYHFKVVTIGMAVLTKDKATLVKTWEDDDEINCDLVEQLRKTRQWLEETSNFLKTAEHRLLCASAVAFPDEEAA